MCWGIQGPADRSGFKEGQEEKPEGPQEKQRLTVIEDAPSTDDGLAVKIGTKGKHLRIIPGWFRVTTGICEEGDMFANLQNPNKPRWSPVDVDDIGDDANFFDCLIRQQKP